MKTFFSSVLPKDTSRIEGLDLLRAIAIVFVVFYHAWSFLSPHFPKIGLLFFMGFWGVEFFFVLSGFLVGGIFIRSYLNANKIDFAFLLVFWKRRWKRILPIYFVVLLSSFLFVTLFYNQALNFPFKYFLFIQNLWTVHPRFFSEAWSLAVEEWFYILLPLVFLLLSMFNKKKSNTLVFYTIILSIIIFTSFRVFTTSEKFDVVFWDFNVRKIVLYRLDAILYGVLAYQILNTWKDFFKIKRYLLLILGLISLCCSYYLFYQKTYIYFNNIFFLTATSLSILLCFPFFYYFKFNTVFIKNLVTIISVSSYSMYLIHYTLVFRVFNTSFETGDILYSFFIFCTYLFTVGVLSVFVYRFVEKPLSVH